MMQTINDDTMAALATEEPEEAEFVRESDQEIVERVASEVVIDGLNPKEARKALIEAMNKIIQAKNGRSVRQYQFEVKEWEAFVLDEKNEGKHAPFPTSPILLTPFNARQLDQAVFRARQYGKFGALLESAGFRPTK